MSFNACVTLLQLENVYNNQMLTVFFLRDHVDTRMLTDFAAFLCKVSLHS